MALSEKSKAILFVIGMTLFGAGIMFGVTYGLYYWGSLDLRTEKECNDLKGTMKNNPIENKDFLSMFPDKANQLQKDNCLEGLKYYHDQSIAFIIIFTLIGGLALGFGSYTMWFPIEETKK